MTRLPHDAPRPYARSQLGPRCLDWCRKHLGSFGDNRRVTRLDAPDTDTDALKRLRGGAEVEAARNGGA
jgi:hypothetical protein